MRLASWSYTTTGSPSLWAAHSLFVPAQSWLIGVAGTRTAPDSEKTTKSLFTIWTYWVEPTSPFVSGGRQLQLDGWAHGSPNGREVASKVRIGPAVVPGPFSLLRP